MRDLINVAFVPSGDASFIGKIRDYWKRVFEDSVPELAPERVKYQDGKPIIPWKQASEIMLQQMAVLKRVNGGG